MTAKVRVDSPLVSTLLVPAAALAVVAGPAVIPPPAPPAVPLVQVEAIQLAGIGQNIYNAITPVVQTVVGDVSYLINFIPLVGGIVAAQVNIDYFQGIQPAVAATVNYAAALLHAPLDFFPITRAYVDTLVGIQYDLVSAQLRFLGFNELPPRPTGARKPGARMAAAAPAAVVTAEAIEPTPTPDRAGRSVRARTETRITLPDSGSTPAAAKSTRPKAAAASEASDQGRGSVDTRRQKSTTGRTRSAI